MTWWKLYTTKIIEAYVYVCNVRLCVSSHFESNYSKMAPPKVKGHPEVKFLNNALWLPNLVGDPWPKCNALLGSKIMQWSPRINQKVKNLGNLHWPPNLVTQNSFPECNTLLGQRSCRSNKGSTTGQYKCQRPTNVALEQS